MTKQLIIKEVVERDESGKVVSLRCMLMEDRTAPNTKRFMEVSRPNVLKFAYVERDALNLLGNPETLEIIIRPVKQV
jgi:hypothetical protein